MAKFMIQETIDSTSAQTVRLGAGTGSSNHLADTELGKFVKFAGESRYQLAAAGDLIEGHILAIEGATADNFTIGSIAKDGLKEVTFDGLQATPGTGVVAIGDFVVVGSVTAKGTALTAAAKVCKATVQVGAVPADLTAAGLQAKAAMYTWQVVSLGSAGTGAVGTTGVIERVGA